MNIPIHSFGSAFDVQQRPRAPHLPIEPAVAKAPPNILAVGGLERPSGRDVSSDLERLFARLADASSDRRGAVALARELGTVPGASTLISFGDLNVDVTSYSKSQLTFGSSTSVASLSGTYAGTGAAASASSLKVDVNQAAALGSNPSALKFTVSDQTGAVLFSYDGVAKAGERISLGSDIGLQIAFSAGSLLNQATASTAVSRTLATDVDAGARYDDPDPSRRPRFEGGAQVTAGSFRLNGRLIEVRADDSITAVLERISENVPGVSASFSRDRVRLQLATQSREAIVVSDDTSGFLAAVKLKGALSANGAAAGDNERLALQTQFARVQAGGFRVGGRYVGIDPSIDSLGSVLERIRQSAPGVVAFLDGEKRQLVVRSGSADRLELTDDSSGFLAAVGLETGPELPARQRFVLDAGAAQRVQQSAASEKSQLVNRTLAALEMPSIQEAAALAGRAKAALAAYDRDGAVGAADEGLSLRRTVRDWPPDAEPVRGARRDVRAWRALARQGAPGSGTGAGRDGDPAP